MAIDPQHIGTLAMAFIEKLEQKYGEEAKIDGLVFLAAVDHGDEGSVEYHASDGEGKPLAPYIAKGIVAMVDKHL